MTFWDHLDELRSVLIRILVVTVLIAAFAFCLKDELFAVVLAPRTSDFITYRLMGVEPFSIHLMNTGLTEQFMIHMKTAFYAGVLVASPYILYVLFRFVSPALYDNEKRYATLLVGTVANMLTLQSYIDTLLMMCLMMGIIFELPVVSWLLGKMGLINASMMQKWRKHAIVTILVAAAIITPTTDAFTLFVVALPIWLLYELSILIVKLNG